MTSPAPLWVSTDVVSAYLGSDAPAAGDAAGQALLLAQTQAATELLYALSGRQFPGMIEATVRPTARPEQVSDVVWSHMLNRWGYGSYGSFPGNGSWGLCHGCGYTGCGGPYMIGLGRSPIESVEEVTIDGNVLDPSEYRVDDRKWLVRQNCSGWPTCQNLAAELGDTATFGVSFTFGQEPPRMGQDACTVMAAELYKSSVPTLQASCALPKRVTSITRQGVSIAVLDSMKSLQEGFTGIASIDMFIAAYNPRRMIRRPMVFSPDLVNLARRQTWP
jgi:hypothetical protein